MSKLKYFFSICTIFCATALHAAEYPWNFADVLDEYVAGRPDFPDATFDQLKPLISQNPAILDIDCRTGIEARQLQKLGFLNVTGCFREAAVIAKARELSPNTIQYVVVDVSQSLPFKDGQFKLAVAFNDLAFLDEGNSLKEISRVVAPNGYFYAVHRGMKSSATKNKWEQILIEELGSLPSSDSATDVSTLYTTEDLLKKAGFNLVGKATSTTKQKHTKEQMFNHMQSTTVWISVKKTASLEQKERILKKLDALLDEQLAKSEVPGYIVRDVTYTTFLFQKPVK